MFLLGAHLVGLFIQLLNLNLFGANVSLQLLDLVVEHELELLEFLNLLLQLANLDVLFLDGGDTRTILLLGGFDIHADFLLLDHFVLKLVLLLLQVFGFGAALEILGGEVAHELGELGLVGEALFNALRQDVLVLVRHHVDGLPGNLFCVGALGDVVGFFVLSLIKQLVVLYLVLFKFLGMFVSHLLK